MKLNTWRLLVGLGTTLLLDSWAAAASQQPNIIFVLADDQTPAYLSCYGGRTPTPHLDRLAKEGARYTSAHSVAPLCNPSRYTVLTGQFPGRNFLNVEMAKPGEAAIVLQNTRLNPDTPCVAEMLRQAGYFTGFVGKWHSNFELQALGVENLPPQPKNPDAPGADAAFAERQRLFALAIRNAARFEHVSHVVWGNNHGPYPVVHHPEWLTDGAIAFIEKAKAEGRPFFLHLANTVPHAPNVCPVLEVDPRYTLSGKLAAPPRSHPPRSTIPERLKAAGLPVSSQQVGALMLDDQIGALRAALQRLKLDDNTLIVFAQDNGQLGKGSVYSGGTHSALVMRWPAGIKAGTVVTENVSFADFVPTFLAVAGATGYKADGVNLLSDEVKKRSAIYCEAGVARSVIKGKYRYIAFRPTPSQIAQMESGKVKAALDTWGNERGGDNHWLIPYKPAFFDPDQLYDREADPLERTNLAGDLKYATVLADMQAELKRCLATMPTPFPLEVAPFVKTEKYAKLVQARRALSAKGDYWPGYPTEDWERNINLNLKCSEEVDPQHRSAWQPKGKGE
jgi:arylsulfatase A